MKRLLLILTMVCLASAGWAGQISREQALQKAQQFMSLNGKHGTLTTAETAMTKARRRSMQVPDYYYVFNAGQDQGYVIVSGDDRTAPILGYSYHGTFDVDKIPCNMAAWLEGYADQIKYIQEHPEAAVTRGDVSTHADVAPLISTTWGQDSPYNNLLPSVGGKKCVTGCGATAIAQIMNYYGAPAGSPAIPGYTTSTHHIACEELPATTFNWANMSSDTEVAKLMKYCAYALQADLDPTGTSAFDTMIVYVLKNYFGYGNGVQEAYHSTYREADWDMLIYNEIANSRPVILTGVSPTDGGHFFILHGYTVSGGIGYYTVNWGWDGFEDGNFLLNAMDPKSMGAGFNDNQSVIVGISPENVTPYQVTETVVLKTVELILSEGEKEYTIPAGYSQFGPVYIQFKVSHDLTRTYDIELNFEITKDGEFIEMLRPDNIQFSGFGPNSLWSGSVGAFLPVYDGVSLGKAFATPGTYKIIPVSRELGSTVWYENIGSDKLFLTGVVSSDMKLTMYVGHPPGSDPTPEVTQADLDELAALYAAQKNAINDKITALASNDAKLNAISQALTQKKAAIDGTASKLNTVKDKLNSDYLTAEQKLSYSAQLHTLESQLATLTSQYDAAKQELTTLQNKSAALVTSLNTLLNTVNSEAAAVAAITTKAALDASKTKVADITAQQTDCNVSAETTKVSALEATVSGLSVTDIETDLTAIDAKIDNDIAVAKKAEEDEKEKQEEAEKLAKAKEAFEAAVVAFDETLQAQELDYEKCLNDLNNIKVVYAELDDAISQIKTKCEEIEKKLQELIAKQTRADDPIAKLQEELKTLTDNIALLEKQYQQIADQISVLDTDVQQYSAVIEAAKATMSQLQSSLASATTAADVESLTASVTKASDTLMSEGVNVYNRYYLEHFWPVIDNLQALIDDVASVDSEADYLEKAVQREMTAILRMIVDESEVLGRYDMKGNPVDSTYKGIQIIRLKNGKTIKLNIK